jgi:hypothetical protein
MEEITIILTIVLFLAFLHFANSDNGLSEPFVSDYYSLNWVSPNLTDYVNTEKVMLSYLACKEENNNLPCTYSMSCDYTDGSSHEACYAGFDMPGDGDFYRNATY